MASDMLPTMAAVLLPVLGAFVPALVGRVRPSLAGWAALPFPAACVALLAAVALGRSGAEAVTIALPWIPSLGINLAFRIDGLSLFFALLVSGMGLLIVLYALSYMDGHYASRGRFYAYLVLFMGAMLGTVLADDLLVMFLFWELTGIASFLLIGFLHEKKGSRVGARQALIVTGATGLALLAGILLLGHAAGTYRLSALLADPPVGFLRSPAGSAALILILLGGLGKSAQFPFFFWLPNAMAAPTPVSAYLHSATMVKLGVFLFGRLFPLLAATDLWGPILLAIGFGTLLLGAALALLQTDLKAILAFTTVSQLGFLCGLYGLGAWTGVQYDLFHILNHTLYKGSLFMLAGIIDHAAHTRDIRELGGLRRAMPLAAAAAAIALAAMAGIPGTTGFLSKELALASLREAAASGTPGMTLALATFLATAVINVVIALRLFESIFLGTPRSDGAAHAHAPSLAFLAPPLLLIAAIPVLGLQPGVIERIVTALRVDGLHTEPPVHLYLWHGVTPELLMSLGALAAGVLLWLAIGRATATLPATPKLLRFDDAFEALLRGVSAASRALTRALQTDRPTSYLPLVLAFFVVIMGATLCGTGLSRDAWSLLRDAGPATFSPMRIFIAALICVSVAGVLVLQRWTTQLISLSVAGFMTTFYFVIYRAPDLALTQILVEAVSLLLVLLLLGRFPKSAEAGEHMQRPGPVRRTANAILATGTGVVILIVTVASMANLHPDGLGNVFLAETMPLAEGSNAVNTVLVDFRGFDTLGEITVLVVATLGCLGLLMRYKRSPEERLEGAAGPGGFAEAERKES